MVTALIVKIQTQTIETQKEIDKIINKCLYSEIETKVYYNSNHTPKFQVQIQSNSETSAENVETEIETTPIQTKVIEESKTESVYIQEESSSETSKEYCGRFKITHCCGCEYCCGENACGITASGTVATAKRTISTSSNFEFGTKLEINGEIYTVEDRGNFDENTIDIYCNTHEEAIEKGVFYADVYIVK